MSRDTLVQKLKTDVAEGRVAVICGTGVSVAACQNQKVSGHAVATWTGLLAHGAEYCRKLGADEAKTVRLLGLIESGEIEFLTAAAEMISERLRKHSPGVFRGWLKDTVGQLEVKDRTILDAVGALPGVLATLNYDTLIETATARRAVNWRQADKTQEVLRREVDDAVLHLHGSFDEPDSVVLGLASYLTVKDDPHAKAVLDTLCMQRAMLLVGCGDTILDPNFTRLIEWGKEALADVAPRHYLLCRASEIDDFQKKLRDAPWLQPLAYGARYEDLAPFLRSLLPAGRPVPRRSVVRQGPGFDLELYQQAMRKHYGRLKLEALDHTTHDISLNLTGMFIAQSARECAEFMPRVFELPKELQRRLREAGELQGRELDEETLNQHRRAYVEQPPRPIVDILSDPAFPRLVVLGDPGSGKSTLLQYLVLIWAEQTAPDLGQKPLPVIVPLREYARLRHEGAADGFLGYLHSGASVRWHFDQAQLDNWLRSNPSLILFDGLDEVFDLTLRREIATSIHRFADEHPLARVVVTSRIIGFQHQVWRDEHFRLVMLQELDDAQIADFISHWHRAAYEDAAKGERRSTLLGNAIQDSAAIRQLAGNPLLLTMMAILNRTQELPRDRAELYSQCARLLLHQWNVDDAFSSDPELSKASLDLKDKRALLLRVARTMQTSDHGLAGNLIDDVALESTLAKGLADVPNLRAERAARALIEQLRGRNFMLCSVGGDRYAFVHRTFLEFFCAVEIRERFETEQSLTFDALKTEVFGHWRDETWHEVLCLLAGMIAPRFVAQIVEWLLEQPDPGNTCHHVFLAANCIGQVRKRAEIGAVEALARERVKALAHFDLHYAYDTWDEETNLIADIRGRAIDAIARIWPTQDDTREWLTARAESEGYWRVCEVALQALAREWRDHPGTLAWFRNIAESDVRWTVRWAAIRELSRSWKDHPDTLPFLKARARSDKDADVCYGALRELVENWKDDPDTLLLLKVFARSDGDERARANAGLDLVTRWKNDPETLPWLKACAHPGESWYLRRLAAQQLARGWKDDPATLPMLMTLAHADPDAAVRSDAMRELTREWKDNPDILPFLKSAADSDEDWRARTCAVEEVARGWKNDPATLRWLQDCVESNDDADVCPAALREVARGWKNDPATLPWLKAHARSDEKATVRGAAVEELVHGWGDEADVLPILKAARLDSHWRVRDIACHELTRRWKDDPDTLSTLKAYARSDPSELIRRRAAHALAEGWRDDPDTLPILQTHARSDKDSAVRRWALRELARGWKDDPDTLTILKEIARSDIDKEVRQRARQQLAHGWKTDPQVRAILESAEKKSPREKN